MDNDNKITRKKTGAGLFLDNLDIKAVSEKDDYVLHEEFKASGKNRNWGIVITLVVMTLALGAASWGITKWIEARNVIRDYELDEFQDVDLMDVLNQVRKVELALEEGERQLIILKRAYENARQTVIEQAQRDTRLLEGSDISQNQIDAGISDINSKMEADLLAVDDEYLEQIAVKEEEIRLLREQLAAYDAEKVQQAQEYEAVIANEKQAFELEKQQLVDSYEAQLAAQEADFNSRLSEISGFQDDLESVLKDTSEGRQSRLFMTYNPVISEANEDMTRLFGAEVDNERFGYDFLNPDPVWIERGYLNPQILYALNHSIADWRKLMAFMTDIPFENSVPGVLEQLEYRYLDIVDQMALSQVGLFEVLFQTETALEETSSRLGETEILLDSTKEELSGAVSELNYERRENRDLIAAIETLDEENMLMREDFELYTDFYDQFSYSLTLRLRDLGGQGILLEPGTGGELFAFMDPFLDIPSGVSGYVFGIDNEYIGQISLEKEDLLYRGEILHKAEERQFNAFNRIFLKISSLTEDGSVEQ